MTLLSDVDIKRALQKGEIKIVPQPLPDQIGAGSIDFTLSNEFWRIKETLKKGKVYDLNNITYLDLFEEIKSDSVILKPGELILGKTLEHLTLSPDIAAWIQGRSRYARLGLSVHVASSFIQPGSSNHQVLEIINFSPVAQTLHAGMRICQVIFQKMISKAEKPYSKFGTFSKQ
jgi:dCTP deaminase